MHTRQAAGAPQGARPRRRALDTPQGAASSWRSARSAAEETPTGPGQGGERATPDLRPCWLLAADSPRARTPPGAVSTLQVPGREPETLCKQPPTGLFLSLSPTLWVWRDLAAVVGVRSSPKAERILSPAGAEPCSLCSPQDAREKAGQAPGQPAALKSSRR